MVIFQDSFHKIATFSFKIVMQVKVDIIVINWNSGLLTMKAIEPYLNYHNSKIKCNIIVVDNASTDNSKALFDNRINRIIYNTKNEGFGKACNQAYKESNAEFILLLNPDTISEPLVLEGLIDFLNNNPKYGVTGPRQLDKEGNVLVTCGRFPSFKTAFFELIGLSKIFPQFFLPAPIMTDWDHSESQDVDHVMGSYMLIRKSIVEKIGFMNESYFTYYEDLDLSKRIAKAGFKTFYNHKYSIFHEGGGSGEKVKTQRLFYSLSSRSIYWKNHFKKYKACILITISFLIEPFLRVMDSIIKERKLNFIKISKAYFLYFGKILRP